MIRDFFERRRDSKISRAWSTGFFDGYHAGGDTRQQAYVDGYLYGQSRRASERAVFDTAKAGMVRDFFERGQDRKISRAWNAGFLDGYHDGGAHRHAYVDGYLYGQSERAAERAVFDTAKVDKVDVK